MAKNRRFIAAAVGLTTLAAALRLPGMFTEFWLDEVWSLKLAHDAGSFAAIFQLHHDNNHWLNTIFLRAMGEQFHWEWYRTLSLVSGIATVPLAGWIARRHFNPAAGVLAMILTTFSYLLVHYSSEARGYAPATCFALLAFLLLDLWIDRPNVWLYASFTLTVILGVLSHQAFIFAYAGLACGSMLAVFRRDRFARAIGKLAALHLPAVAFMLWLYFHDIRGQTVGGANHQMLGAAMIDLLRWSVAAPKYPPIFTPCAIIVIALFVCGLIRLARTPRDHAWLTMTVACILAPAVLLLSPFNPIFPSAKFFQIPIALALIVIAGGMAKMIAGKSIFTKACAILILGGFIGGNCANLIRFWRDGRGHFLPAMQFIAAHTDAADCTIVSNQGWRTKLLLNFYARYLPKKITYAADRPDPQNLPMWALMLGDDIAPFDAPPTVYAGATGQSFVLLKEFPYFGPVGFRWYVYQYKPGE